MPKPKYCVECGTPLPATMAGGLCAACALRVRSLLVNRLPPCLAPARNSVPSATTNCSKKSPAAAWGRFQGPTAQPQPHRGPEDDPGGASWRGRAMCTAFHQGSRRGGKLQHPNIVAIHEAGEVEGQQFYTMDFVEGRSLAAIMHGIRCQAARPPLA